MPLKKCSDPIFFPIPPIKKCRTCVYSFPDGKQQWNHALIKPYKRLGHYMVRIYEVKCSSPSWIQDQLKHQPTQTGLALAAIHGCPWHPTRNWQVQTLLQQGFLITWCGFQSEIGQLPWPCKINIDSFTNDNSLTIALTRFRNTSSFWCLRNLKQKQEDAEYVR